MQIKTHAWVLSSWPWGHHYGVLGRDGGGTGLRLAESPPTYGAAGSRGWFDGNKPQKALLSTQVHPETLMAGRGEAVAVSQMGKDQSPFCARTSNGSRAPVKCGVTLLLSVAK